MDNKLKCLCLLAIMLAIIGIEFPLSTTTGTQWVLNTTNLAPTFPGEEPGTGERVADNTTYWANSSPKDVYVWAHANSTGNVAEIHLYINGTKYEDVSGKPLGVAEQNNKTVFATIPQFANYSVEVVSAHHYEWRETQILTGNVSTTVSGTGCTGNCSFNAISINELKKNDTTDTYGSAINLSVRLQQILPSSGETSSLDLNSGQFSQIAYINPLTGFGSSFTAQNNFAEIVAGDGTSSTLDVYTTHVDIIPDVLSTANYSFNSTYLDMGGRNLTNCYNCDVANNSKVNKSGDTWTGDMISDGHSITTPKTYIFSSSATPTIRMSVYDLNSSFLELFENSFNISFANGATESYAFDKNGLDMGNKNITNVNYNYMHHSITQKTNDGSYINALPDDSPPGGSNYLMQLTSENNSGVFLFQTYQNVSTAWNGFNAIAYNGTVNNYSAMPNDASIFSIGARGSISSSAISAGKVAMWMYTGGIWNTTSNPTYIRFATTPKGSTTRTNAFNISDSQNIEVMQAGKGITMYSPNGNAWCTTVSNLGALTTVAGRCT